MKLEEKLVSLRKAKGLSQMKLAEKMNVSRQAISRWETGAAIPSSENLKYLSDLYKEENIMLLPHFRANFKTGYWEAVFSHTRPLGVVPWDMRG